MKINPSKQKVIEAATELFFQKGFHGTSVRDIADKARVNVSLISYYFKGKQGLLEFAVTDYYEKYLETVEATIKQNQHLNKLQQLKELIFFIIQYKQTKHQFSCFIHRELSLDSVFVREISVTYLAKENHLLTQAFYGVLDEERTSINDRTYLFMQLKGMLVTPYMMPNEWKHQIIGEYSHQIFVRNYVKTIHDWLDCLVMKQKNYA
ncbi:MULTISPECIES: forespore capture DNA-binding protein RefZ [Virgibacillus]|uniref:DNA-binding transcriptional regulator, AcrR family n=1 Tax=Virgibacillus chiguensis TaxID=411959 RepID=A0A1M5V0E4_9BACI|nr:MULTISPECIES: forespore capture DNA-binding protein RefZ [Virgibacillus]SHH68646.1 DNA-binding transcriptional regulator, AcrR family [Virgibacillus chiguensis]